MNVNISVKLNTDKNFNRNRDIDIKQFMPTVLRDVDEVKTIMAVQNDEMKKHWDITEEIFDNQFICTAKLSGIKLFENMHQLSPSTTDSLEQRRLRIYILYNRTAPYTRKYMMQFLDGTIGAGNYDLRFYTGEFRLEIDFYQFDTDLIRSIAEWLEDVTPYTLGITRYSVKRADTKLYVGGAVRRTTIYKLSTGAPWNPPHSIDQKAYVGGAVRRTTKYNLSM